MQIVSKINGHTVPRNVALLFFAAEPERWFRGARIEVVEFPDNAVYHRSYEESVEPTKVYLYPNRIEVVSYPGPVPGIERAHLSGNAPRRRCPPATGVSGSS